MGHYLSEMWVPWQDARIELEYYTKWRDEISDVLNKNPIQMKDLKVGDTIKLYRPFEEKSRYSWPGYPKRPLKQEFHRVMDSMLSEYLDQFDTFKLPMKVEKLKFDDWTKTDLLFLNVPIYPGLIEPWYDIKYFEKVK